MSTYRSFYRDVEPVLVRDADPKRFPVRQTAHQAAKDAADYWHKEGYHLVPYQIDSDGTVTQLTTRIHRVMEVVK